jgi:beta-glucosidase-like glycosyl hydrolase/CubicO group peptidase (beta-lactamase class C family)
MVRRLKYILFLSVVAILFSSFYLVLPYQSIPVFLQEKETWSDSILNSMTLDEKIGQLFMVAAYSNKDQNHENGIELMIEKNHIGGLIFFQGGPVRQVRLTNRYQSKSKVPLLIAMDAEWGLGMRLDSTISYPRQMMLGAIQDNRLVFRMGEDIAMQCKRLGVHVNFAPVIDVNVNPKNPVINSRSFGEQKQNVGDKGLAYMNGMQKHHVLAVAKHFPGHGDTDKDSHKALPLVKHDINRLNDIELYPFKTLFDSGCGGVMVAHLLIPAIDSTPNRATTLSPKVVTGLLRNKLGFKGLVFTDALNMKGVSNFYKPGEADLLALLAGNDVLLFPKDVPLAIQMIKSALDEGSLSEADLNEHVLKILKAKYWVGLNKYEPINQENIYENLNKVKYQRLYRQLISKSITLLKNKGTIIPFKNLENKTFASVAIGGYPNNYFQKKLKSYADVSAFNISKEATDEEVSKLIKQLEPYSEIIVSFHKPSRSPSKHFGVTKKAQDVLAKIAQNKSVTLVSFTNPYVFNWMNETSKCNAVVVSYNDKVTTQEIAAQLLFGGVGAAGKVPVSAGEFESGIGYDTEAIRFSYGVPSDVGMNPIKLAEIDSIAKNAIKNGATPGCQILIAKDNKIIWNKAYGWHTYEKKTAVQPSDIYDLASLTKVVATLPSIMQLVDAGKVELDGSLGMYLPELVSGTEYAKITLREMLAHQAGLRSWIPFYLNTLENGVPRYDIYSLESSETYSIEVANDLYINKMYPDSMMKIIVSKSLKTPGDDKYSDLGYYFLKAIVEKVTGSSLDQYAMNHFYAPMGMTTTGYHPSRRFPLTQIVPTENDTYFRNQLIHGMVHDPGAAMQGGVGGHAGVFSNAEDLAKIWQMYLNKGSYGGVSYVDTATVAEFTKCQYCEPNDKGNRRAIGFDKPVRGDDGGPTCSCVSYASFGHTGFTGTISWADPEENLIYIFLSNRIYPTTENRKLVTMNVRTDIMEVIYASLNDTLSKDMSGVQ